MADFPYNPDFGYQRSPDYNVLVKEYANGVDQARLISTKKINDPIDLPFTIRDKTETDAAEAFFDSKFGSLTIFTISIDGVEYSGRFVRKSFYRKHIGPQIYNYGFQFKEVA
jgi:hypothetical protein